MSADFGVVLVAVELLILNELHSIICFFFFKGPAPPGSLPFSPPRPSPVFGGREVAVRPRREAADPAARGFRIATPGHRPRGAAADRTASVGESDTTRRRDAGNRRGEGD